MESPRDCKVLRGGMILGEQPVFSWNRVKPVEAFTVFIIAKRIRDKFFDHPFWLASTWYQTIWLSVLFVRSLAPSVSGWYAVDIFSLTPVSL